MGISLENRVLVLKMLIKDCSTLEAALSDLQALVYKQETRNLT